MHLCPSLAHKVSLAEAQGWVSCLFPTHMQEEGAALGQPFSTRISSIVSAYVFARQCGPAGVAVVIEVPAETVVAVSDPDAPTDVVVAHCVTMVVDVNTEDRVGQKSTGTA